MLIGLLPYWNSLMRKPETCRNCPLYETSTEFTPDEVREGASVMVVGQNPGQEEAAQGRPFVGKTGKIMEAKYLKSAGLSRDDISIGNSLRCRWKNTNDLPPVSSVVARAALAHCTREHFRPPPGIRLLISQGDYAATMLTGGTVTDGDRSTGWRGYLRPYLGQHPVDFTEPWVPQPSDLPVLVTTHLAKLFHEPWLTMATYRDWTKIPQILRRTWPRRPPKYLTVPPVQWPEMFTFDTEWPKEEPDALTRYSMAWGDGDDQACVVEAGNPLRSPKYPPILSVVPRVVTQYAPADVRHLDRLSGWGDRGKSSVWQRFLIEDAVWKHSVLWSDHRHDLNYLGSVYASFNRWKHLSETNPTLYAVLDAVGLFEVDRALERELDADPQSRRVWTEIDRPALGEFVRAQYRGLRTNPARVAEVRDQLQRDVDEAQLMALAIVGRPFNIGSASQSAHRLYVVEGIKEPK